MPLITSGLNTKVITSKAQSIVNNISLHVKKPGCPPSKIQEGKIVVIIHIYGDRSIYRYVVLKETCLKEKVNLKDTGGFWMVQSYVRGTLVWDRDIGYSLMR